MKTSPRDFRQLDRPGRVNCLVEEGLLTSEQADGLLTDTPLLPHAVAEHMIENVIGAFALPLGIAPGIVVNDKAYDVPLVIEEPSVVAAQANSGKAVRLSGGYVASSSAPIMTGQIQLLDIPDPETAIQAIEARRDEILADADSAIPGIVRRGGGSRDLEIRLLQHPEDDAAMLVVHIHIDVQEAMGANAINTIAEAIAPGLESMTGGRAVLRILSNLTDRRLTRAECHIDVDQLAVGDMSGADVAKGVEEASKLAEIDPYRAATHNKGTMNGIDALLLATGNDFRAIEAGAHAYAARNGIYSALSTWRTDGKRLHGKIELPMALGTVGGQVKTHPWVAPLLQLLDIQSTAELANLAAAVGLGQNLGALRALASKGIQAGHMAMHARTIAMEVGAQGDEVQRVADKIKALGKIDRATAEHILAELRS